MSLRAVVAVLLGVACVGPGEVPPEHSLSRGGYAMGTVLELTLRGPDPDALEQAAEEAFALARQLDDLLSIYVASSDVSRLNAQAGQGPKVVAPEVALLLRTSLAARITTRGAFDVTVGPLVDLWIDAAAIDRVPTRGALEDALARIGPGALIVHPDGRASLRPGAAVNLGGIAKGFALDRMRSALAAHGVTSALLNFGQSSTWAIGRPSEARGWRLLARAPQGGFAGVLTLRDQALSVSGSLGQWSEIQGRRYGHVLDPRSGQPLVRRREALVVAPSAATADVLSTALLVLGEREGIAIVNGEPGCEGLLLDADGSRWQTPGWSDATRFEAIDDAP